MKTNKGHPEIIILLILLILIPSALISQGINIITGGIIKSTGTAFIKIIDGNFVNNGTYINGEETVIMSGSSAKTISGSGTTTMYNLEITNTGGITTKLPLLTTTTLNIAASSKFTIDTTRAVSVVNTVSNNAGTAGLLIKSSALAANGSLIFHNANENPVSATVEMYSKATKVETNNKWQFFGIPVRSLAKYPTFYNPSYVRMYNEAGWYTGLTSDKHWIQLVNGNTLTPFTGYEVTQNVASTYSFAGELVNSNYNSGKLAYTPAAQYPGQHLIGNPYTAAIDISKIVFGSDNPLVMENTVYLYNTGSYNDWVAQGSGGLSASKDTIVPGQYVAVPYKAGGNGGLPTQIPSMQAFLVRANSDNSSATVSISYTEAGTIVKNTSKQRSSNIQHPCTIIDVKGSGFGDRMWLISEPSCSHNFENGWDGTKMYSEGATQLFAMESSGNYQVNTVDDIHNSYLGFQAGATDTYTMTFTNENTSSQYSALYLIDMFENNKVTDITNSGTTYTFSSNATDTPEKRFKIVTNFGAITDNQTIGNEKISVYCFQNTVFINNVSNINGILHIYDIMGRLIQNTIFNAKNNSSLPINLPAGTYLVKAKVGNDELVQRIIIQ